MRVFLIVFIFIVNLEATNYKSLLFHGNCITCHFEQKAVSAPSVIEFKQQYNYIRLAIPNNPLSNHCYSNVRFLRKRI